MNLGLFWNSGCWGELEADYEKAEFYFKKASEDGYGPAYINLAEIYIDAGRPLDALTTIEKGLLGAISYKDPSFQLDGKAEYNQEISDISSAFFIKGEILLKLEDYDGCLENFSISAKLEKENLRSLDDYSVASINEALCAQKSGKREYAAKKFADAISVMKNSDNSLLGKNSDRFLIAKIYNAFNQRDTRKAVSMIKVLLKDFEECCPDRAYKIFEFHIGLSRLYLDLKELENAEKSLKIAEEILNQYESFKEDPNVFFDFAIAKAGFFDFKKSNSKAQYFAMQAFDIFKDQNKNFLPKKFKPKL